METNPRHLIVYDIVMSQNRKYMYAYREDYAQIIQHKTAEIFELAVYGEKISIDEFPQFINVFIGNMSLIGPRPLVKGELDQHNGNHELYESVKPGISGWWAANGRSNTTYEQRMTMELYYVDNISWKLDVKIFLKTILSVLNKEGAR